MYTEITNDRTSAPWTHLLHVLLEVGIHRALVHIPCLHILLRLPLNLQYGATHGAVVAWQAQKRPSLCDILPCLEAACSAAFSSTAQQVGQWGLETPLMTSYVFPGAVQIGGITNA